MKLKRVLAPGLAAMMGAGAVVLVIGGSEAAGMFKESAPGKVLVVKVPSGTKWSNSY
jgi:hypothetical protein